MNDIYDDDRHYIFENIPNDYEHVRIFYHQSPNTWIYYGNFLRNDIYDIHKELFPLPYDFNNKKPCINKIFKF